MRRAAILLLTMIVPAAAQAQSVCGDRAKLIEVLAIKYHETPAAFGIAGSRNLVELFISPAGSFTMLITEPRGVTCILATGQGWEELPIVPPSKMGEPS